MEYTPMQPEIHGARRASTRPWQTCSDTVSQRRVAMKVAGLAVWAEALPETKLTDEQVPLSYRHTHL